MKFGINYRYNETYLPTSRCRKLRHREVNTTVEVEIPSLTRDQVHPVFRVTEYDMYKSGFVTEMIYQYDNRLWKVSLKDNFRCGAPHEPATAENLKEIFNRYKRQQCIQLGSQEDELALAVKYSKDFLLIDNELYHPCGEPMYNITTFGLGNNHGGTGFFVEYNYNPNIPNRNYFNALHRTEAIEYALRVAAKRGDTESIPHLCNSQYNIEVLDTHAVHRNPMRDHGSGDAFLNMLDSICSSSNSIGEAVALVMCATAAEMKTK